MPALYKKWRVFFVPASVETTSNHHAMKQLRQVSYFLMPPNHEQLCRIPGAHWFLKLVSPFQSEKIIENNLSNRRVVPFFKTVEKKMTLSLKFLRAELLKAMVVILASIN
jgi:hypothetical protein